MSSPFETYYVLNGSCIHGADPNSTIAYLASPNFTTLTTNSPSNRRSPQLIISPQLVPSPLSPSLAIVNLSGSSRRNSPSPVTQTLLIATPTVDPLVAPPTDLRSPKLHYDVSRDPRTASISTYGIKDSISSEQKNYLVVENALPNTSFRIAFDHPLMTGTVGCDSCLTIGDLIQLLHDHFQQPLGSKELSKLDQYMDLSQSATNNRHKRCQAAFDPLEAWKEGMKKIDVLGKECKFRGVELDLTSANNRLTLRVALGK